MEAVNAIVAPAYQFTKDSYRLIQKCTKPDKKGFF